MSSKNIIDQHLNGAGDVIIKAASSTGLELALACALVEQESGGHNIFGIDHGSVGDVPPYSHHPVTKERVQRLRDNGNYTHGMNGVGLTQITWWEFVERAERLGGAHIPLNQCLVGFKILVDYLGLYPYKEALAAYNAGESNRFSVIHTYAEQVAAKHERWRRLLMETFYKWELYGWFECEDNCNKIVRRQSTDKTGSGSWEDFGYYVIGKDGSAIYKKPPAVKSFKWPVANAAPVAGNYQQRHPTRYTWRSDVEGWARYLVQNYDVWCNTYWDHPENYWRDEDSFDVWGPGGRNDPLDWSVGDTVFNKLFNAKGAPYIEWIIWRRRIYGKWNGWKGQPFGTNAFEWHDDHIHCTYL